MVRNNMHVFYYRPEWPELEVPFLNRNTERNLIVSPWSNIDPTHTQLGELIPEGSFLFLCTFISWVIFAGFHGIINFKKVSKYLLKPNFNAWKWECCFRQSFTPSSATKLGHDGNQSDKMSRIHCNTILSVKTANIWEVVSEKIKPFLSFENNFRCCVRNIAMEYCVCLKIVGVYWTYCWSMLSVSNFLWCLHKSII